MQENTNRPLLVALIIIGIIIIAILLSRSTPRMTSYSYRGYGLTASTVPFGVQQTPDSDYYTFVRHIPIQQRATYTTYSYPSSYTYYQPTQQTYPSYPGETVFSDGCTLTSPYSTTTGLPCS